MRGGGGGSGATMCCEDGLVCLLERRCSLLAVVSESCPLHYQSQNWHDVVYRGLEMAPSVHTESGEGGWVGERERSSPGPLAGGHSERSDVLKCRLRLADLPVAEESVD